MHDNLSRCTAANVVFVPQQSWHKMYTWSARNIMSNLSSLIRDNRCLIKVIHSTSVNANNVCLFFPSQLATSMKICKTHVGFWKYNATITWQFSVFLPLGWGKYLNFLFLVALCCNIAKCSEAKSRSYLCLYYIFLWMISDGT